VRQTVKTGRLTTRFLGGPALRVQPDGRLVSLVREGYESAFEEIFRRYGAALRSYAASIVTAQRADDVTQEAFTKAYLALRGTEKEIQLRPWLYRIVRNTALSDIRDEPKPGVELDDAHATDVSPEEMAEQREEIARLMRGLRELPEPQRAAIVMRELEGLSHEQIAASLGLSGGAVRQSIYRARRKLREGVGLLMPLPLLRLLLEEGFSQGASAAAAGGGAGIAVKTGVAALLAAGTVTTGAVLDQELKRAPDADAKVKVSPAGPTGRERSALTELSRAGGSGPSSREHGDDSGHGGHGRDRGRDRDDGPSDDRGEDRHEGRRSGTESEAGESEQSQSGPGSSGPGSSGSGSGSSGPGSGGTESVDGGSTNSGPGSGSSGSGSSGSGSDDALELDD
jgi:RNA polymerase sigma factor (sigma-70 family)